MRREPKVGDRVWIQDRHRNQGKQPNGTIINIIYDDGEVSEYVIRFLEDGVIETYDAFIYELVWTNKLGGLWECPSTQSV